MSETHREMGAPSLNALQYELVRIWQKIHFEPDRVSISLI